MSVVNPIPPQAYTKETLQKAYSWLLTQSASIKEMAATQEILVSLYLKAQRNGEASLETPSIQNFKQELKSLAHMMGDLQGQNGQQAQASVTNTTGPAHSTKPTSINLNSSFSQLDQLSLQAIHDVKQNLNLSSEIEAVRALISLGYKQFKKI